MRYSIFRNIDSDIYIQSIKSIRSVLKLDLKTAKSIIDHMRYDRLKFICPLSENEVLDLRMCGFEVISTQYDQLSESLFDIGENKQKKFEFENGVLKIHINDCNININLTDNDVSDLVSILGYGPCVTN